MLVVTGLGFGFVATVGMRRLLSQFLYNLSTSDPVTYFSDPVTYFLVLLVLLIGTLLACLVPSRSHRSHGSTSPRIVAMINREVRLRGDSMRGAGQAREFAQVYRLAMQ